MAFGAAGCSVAVILAMLFAVGSVGGWGTVAAGAGVSRKVLYSPTGGNGFEVAVGAGTFACHRV